MKAGRDLDALIAEKVMGWTMVEIPGSGKWRVNADRTISCPEELCPPYSTDIAAAWEIVEKLKTIPVESTSWAESFNEPFPIVLALNSGKWVCKWSPVYWANEYEAEAETAPHAICLAALRASGYEVSATSGKENSSQVAP